MNPWIYLLIAIVAEVIGTSALKLSKGFTVLGPSLVVVAGYASAFYSLSLALGRGMALGTAYAVWSGVGTALIAVIGWLIFNEGLNAKAVLGIALIIAGVILLNLNSSAH
ncbi:DMT family transporter [Deinococcus fonticola]|uniref:DMT family transporter n=1 Tax=Deinococcus fonticola TaxID=2528713 RepID=UPI001074B2F4|nr:multidrug efflux SMR transporter [Deinococcus fonticola]